MSINGAGALSIHLKSLWEQLATGTSATVYRLQLDTGDLVVKILDVPWSLSMVIGPLLKKHLGKSFPHKSVTDFLRDILGRISRRTDLDALRFSIPPLETIQWWFIGSDRNTRVWYTQPRYKIIDEEPRHWVIDPFVLDSDKPCMQVWDGQIVLLDWDQLIFRILQQLGYGTYDHIMTLLGPWPTADELTSNPHTTTILGSAPEICLLTD